MPDTTSLPTVASLSQRLRNLSRRSITALLCLVLLLLGLPLGLLTWQLQQGGRLAFSHLSPTQSAQATETALSQTQAEATLAAQARVEATAGITSSIGAGKILYANNLTSQGSGWINDGYQCFFSSQGYHVQTAAAHQFAWCYSGQQTFTNMVISAQAQLKRGDVYGLVFRLNPTAQQFYALEINKEGEYRLVLAAGSNPNAWLTLIDWTHSGAIQTGYNQTNMFLVVASGSNFRVYLNKQLVVTSYTNVSYVSGLIGFLVGGDTVGGTEAIFSNILVFKK